MAELQIRCVVVDDHPPVLEALAGVLAGSGIDVVGTARSGKEAVHLVRRLRPDVALLDIRLPDLSGVEALRRIALLAPGTRVALYTGYSDAALLREGLEAGAQAVVLKESPVEEVVQAVRAAASGRRHLDPAAAALLEGAEGPALTPRERQVLQLLAAGLETDEVARRLGLSPHTLRTHIANAMAKLKARTRPQAVAEALRRRLIP